VILGGIPTTLEHFCVLEEMDVGLVISVNEPWELILTKSALARHNEAKEPGRGIQQITLSTADYTSPSLNSVNLAVSMIQEHTANNNTKVSHGRECGG
jgi:hypothetical protein